MSPKSDIDLKMNKRKRLEGNKDTEVGQIIEVEKSHHSVLISDETGGEFSLQRNLGDERIKKQANVPLKKTKRGDTRNADLNALSKKEDGYPIKENDDYISPITIKAISPGDTFLGRVKEINEFELSISLPHGLVGTVALVEMSDLIAKKSRAALEDDDEVEIPDPSDHFFFGQMVICSVLSVESKPGKNKKKKISLSLRPDAVNKGIMPEHLEIEDNCLCAEVRSVEEYGCTLVVGLKDSYPFLNFKNGLDNIDSAEKKYLIKEGAILVCGVVKNSPENQKFNKYTMALYPRDPQNTLRGDMKIKQNSSLGLDDIKAGAMVVATVEKVFENYGISFLISGLIKAHALKIHIPIKNVSQEYTHELSDYKKGDMHMARVIWVSKKYKKLHISLKPDVIYSSTPQNIDKHIGEVYDDFKVVDLHFLYGVTVFNEATGYSLVHAIQMGSETSNPNLIDSKIINTIKRGKIIGYDMLDNIKRISFDKSVIDAAFIRISDLKPGAIVRGKVVSLENYGAIVVLGTWIRALCLKCHFADAPFIKSKKSIFKINNEYQFMVLNVDYKNKKVLLTHKKTLMESKLEKIQSYDMSHLKKWVHGVIVAIKDYGLIVEFLANVKGLIPIKETKPKNFDESTARDEDLSQNFTLNQVIKCCVIYTNPTDNKMVLSLNPSFNKVEDKVSNNAIRLHLEVGEKVSGKVLKKIDEKSLLIAIDGAQDAPAVLDKFHLSDFKVICDLTWNSIELNHQLNDLYVVSLTSGKGYPILTKKKSMVNFMQKYLHEMGITNAEKFQSFLKPGMIFVGYVNEIQGRRFIVKSWGNSFGIVGASDISEKYLVNLDGLFFEGQTVYTKVRKIDEEYNRIFLTMCPSELPDHITNESYNLQLIKDFFYERDTCVENIQIPRESYPPLNTVLSGQVIEHVNNKPVIRINDYLCGVLFQLKPSLDNSQILAGDIIEGTVLDRCFSSSVIDVLNGVSNAQKKLSSPSEKFFSNIRKKIEEGRIYNAIKVASKGPLGILIIPDLKNLVVYAWLCVESNSCFGAFIGGFSKKLNFRITLNELNDDGRVLGCVKYPQEKIDTSGKFFYPREIINPVDPIIKHIDDVKKGMIIKAKILSIKKTQINLYLAENLRGRIHVLEICDSLEEGDKVNNALEKFKISQIIEAKVIGFHDSKSHRYLPFSHRASSSVLVVDFTLRPSKLTLGDINPSTEALLLVKNVPLGARLIGYIESIKMDVATVRIDRYFQAKLPLLRAHNKAGSINILKDCHHNQHVKLNYYWVERKSHDNVIELSGLDPNLNPIPTLENLELNRELVGVVVKISPTTGLILRLSKNLYGSVHLTEIYSYYCEDPTKDFRCGQYLDCETILLNKEKRIVDLSLRGLNNDKGLRLFNEKKLSSINASINSIDELGEGRMCSGYVVKKNDTYAIIELGRGGARAFLGGNRVKNNSFSRLKEGELVMGYISRINKDNRKIEMTLFEHKVDIIDENWNSLIEENQIVVGKVYSVNGKYIEVLIEGVPLLGRVPVSNITNEANFDIKLYYNIGDRVRALVLKRNRDHLTLSLNDERLKEVTLNEAETKTAQEIENSVEYIKIGVKPLVVDLDDKDNFESKDTLRNVVEPTLKKAKLEESITLINQDSSDSKFESLLFASPNSSYLWIKYIAFQLSISNIEKAREVARRALDKINFREENERLNIWIAWMNLENAYGSSETFESVVKNASLQAKAKKVYLLATNILIHSKKQGEVEKMYEIIFKKFRTSHKVWKSYLMYLMRKPSIDEARMMLQKCIEVIPKHKHIKIISSFAQLEFKFGDPERGRTMFEGIIKSYPNRMDIWSIYTDMEIIAQNVESVRRILDRLIVQKLSSKKMKFAFKKYMNFELKYGTPQGVETIKRMAINYLENIS